MTERDMLINLIDKAIYECDDNYGIPNSNQMADFLLANGVKVPPVVVGTTVSACDDIEIIGNIHDNPELME